MKLFRIVSLVLITLCSALFTHAQQQEDWVPEGLQALRQEASSKTEFSVDHSMLVFASKLDSDDADLRRVIAGVSGLSVHNYRFPAPWAYDPATLTSVKEEYHEAGWKQVVNNHEKGGGPGVTDVWVRLEHSAISNVAVLVASAKEVNLIEVSGSISPLDLLRLCGHFGIPRIEGGIRVPNGGQGQ